MPVTTSKTIIRGTDAKDKPQIRAIRKQFYSGGLDDPAVRYMAAERDGKITAICGLKMDASNQSRCLVVDMYGTNVWDWLALVKHTLYWADRFGIQLSAWCAIDNRYMRLFKRLGFVESMSLIRREAR